jgi:DNA-binding Lrp family transcriptional regulator
MNKFELDDIDLKLLKIIEAEPSRPQAFYVSILGPQYARNGIYLRLKRLSDIGYVRIRKLDRTHSIVNPTRKGREAILREA